MAERIRTVEYDPGWGWIARSPYDGHEIGGDGFRWRTRDVARTVVWETRLLDGPSHKHSPHQPRATVYGPSFRTASSFGAKSGPKIR